MAELIKINGKSFEWSTIDELIESRARSHADTHAMEIAGERLTYGELAEQAGRVAANLYRLGIRKGDRVATFMPNMIEQVLTWFGTIKLGAIWVPFNAGLVGDDLAYTLEDASPSILVVAGALRHHVDNIPPAREMTLFVAGGDASLSYRPFADLLADCEPAPAIMLHPGDPAAIMYTGGTTGMPKGAVLPHFAWIAAGYRYRECYGVQPTDRHFSVLKLFHNGALMLGVIGPMVCAIPTTIDANFSLSNFWRRIRETGSTIIDMVGPVMILLAQAAETPDERDNGVRISLAPIVSVPMHIVERFRERFNIALVNLYAQSEAGGVVTIFGDPDSPKLESNGYCRGWAEIAIVDEYDFPVPAGTTGQICLRPLLPHIFMIGYHNQPKKTVETFANLWLHTGDLGHLDAEGHLYFTGRQLHFLRRRGENISAYEVEAVLMQHPSVSEAVVIGVPSELSDDEVKAFLVARDGMTVDPAEIVAWCRERIAAFKVPRFIQIVAEFPRSAAKSEVERFKLLALGNDQVWDSEQCMKPPETQAVR